MKFWSEVEYNFVYGEHLKALDRDKRYPEYLPKVRATASTAEYYDVLMQLCARLQDGHTNVYPADEVFAAQKARTMITTHLIEGRVLVRGVFDPALRAQGVLPGVDAMAVDGEPAVAFGKRVDAPYQSSSTAQDVALHTFSYAFPSGPLAKAPTVTSLDAGGKTFDAVVKRYDNATCSKAVSGRPPSELRVLPGGVAHVAHVALNSFGNDDAANGVIGAFDQIAKAAALLIDVRNNGGGSSYVGDRVLATLTGNPFATGKWSTRSTSQAIAPGAGRCRTPTTRLAAGNRTLHAVRGTGAGAHFQRHLFRGRGFRHGVRQHAAARRASAPRPIPIPTTRYGAVWASSPG